MPDTALGGGSSGLLFRRPEGFDWGAIEGSLTERGQATVPGMLPPATCSALIALYGDDRRFRSRIDMARHNFGEGDYAYFAEPLPDVVSALRARLYVHLAPIANRLTAAMGRDVRYPPSLAAFRRRCRAAGQSRPTPLLLHYRAGGFNCLHRDLYGNTVFPLQAVFMLSRRGRDYAGGEFVLVENRPRQQSRAQVLTPDLGDMVIFPVAERPVRGRRGMLRAAMRHGVSQVISGERWTLGIIFHDAA